MISTEPCISNLVEVNKVRNSVNAHGHTWALNHSGAPVYAAQHRL